METSLTDVNVSYKKQLLLFFSEISLISAVSPK